MIPHIPMAAKKKSSSRKKSTRASTRRKVSKRAASAAPPPRLGLTLDQKLDIAGWIMAALGAVTLYGLFRGENGPLLGGWLRAVMRAFGWGGYVLPIGLFITGLWLVLRRFERTPRLSVDRALGFVLLFIWALVALQVLVELFNASGLFLISLEGRGGGSLGALMLGGLQNLFGSGGAAIVLLTWLLLGVMIAFDKTVLEIIAWFRPLGAALALLGGNLRKAVQMRLARRPELTVSPVADLPAESASIPVAGAVPGADASATPVESSPRPMEWVLPPLDEALDDLVETLVDDEFNRQQAQIIEEALASFGAPGRVVEINRGPTITQFGVEPDFIAGRGGRRRVRVSKIANLADDLALALAARRVRIEAPVPGKGYVGIEVPNEQIALVSLREGITSPAFQQLQGRPLRFALGQDVSGNAVAADLAAMPHLLIAGTTGSGKSVCVNAIIACLLMHNTPDQLRFIMVDPKRVELTGYDGIPHLLAPVVVELDRVIGALQWVTREMDSRYEKFADLGARNLIDYNARAAAQGLRKLPYLVVVIDELADLMMLAPDATERAITRMAQLARATGIHMVISTQRPSVDVVTGLIKANFPARIAFATASGTDSRVILDQPGAERLLGRGDMLFQAPDAPAPVRLQGVFVSDVELRRIVQFWRAQNGYVPPTSAATAAGGHPDGIPPHLPLKQLEFWEEEKLKPQPERDPLYDEAVDLVRRKGRASISMLQRALRIGYTRAARLIDTMEHNGIISGPTEGPAPRQVLDYGPAAPPVDEM